MTPAEPVRPRPAATVMLVRDAPDLEVLLLRRSPKTPFVPGAHVFPGGALEAADDAPSADVFTGLDDATASRLLGVEDGGIAYWVTAVRECLEEAGVLLAVDADGRWVDHSHPALADLDALRDDVERGRVDLAAHLRTHGLRVPLDRLGYVSRWITPEVSPRRYDTRFFVAPAPPEQAAAPDRWETVAARWWTPTQALADWQAEAIDLIEPTVASLRLLAEFPTAERALDALRRAAHDPARVTDPGGGVRVALPADLAGDAR